MVYTNEKYARKPVVSADPQAPARDTSEDSGNPNNSEPHPANPPDPDAASSSDSGILGESGSDNVEQQSTENNDDSGERSKPSGKLTLHAIYTAIDSWVEAKKAIRTTRKEQDVSGQALQTEDVRARDCVMASFRVVFGTQKA